MSKIYVSFSSFSLCCRRFKNGQNRANNRIFCASLKERRRKLRRKEDLFFSTYTPKSGEQQRRTSPSCRIAEPPKRDHHDHSHETANASHCVGLDRLVPEALDDAGPVGVDGVDGDGGRQGDEEVHENPGVLDSGQDVLARDAQAVVRLGRVVEEHATDQDVRLALREVGPTAEADEGGAVADGRREEETEENPNADRNATLDWEKERTY